MARSAEQRRGPPAAADRGPAEARTRGATAEAKRAAPTHHGETRTATSPTSGAPLATSGAPAIGVRLVVLDLDTLRATLRELLAEMLSGPASPDFYSQACLPPGMTRRAFLDAIRRGDLPARASGKIRFVARADYQAFVANAPPVRVRVDKQPTPANDVRALVRAAQGKR